MNPAARSALLCLVLACSAAAPQVGAGQDADPGSAEPATAASVAHLIEEAEAARSQAAALDAEWLETRTLIEKAREAAANQNWQEATGLAAKAKQQGELAVAQAKREATAWRHRVVR